jgi:nucleotide-binding universal stress UspA family protein
MKEVEKMRWSPKKILCTSDFSDLANDAIPYGVDLANAFGAKLYLCHVIDLTSVAMYGEAITAFEEQQKRMRTYALDQLSQLMAGKDVDWEPLIATGHVAETIAHLAADKDVELVVSANRGRSGLKRLILGSVTGRLMRVLPCPILIVRSPGADSQTVAEQGIRYRRILVGCDFSSDSALAFEYGLSLAQEFQAEFHLAHVIEPAAYKDLLKSTAEWGEMSEKDLREQLNEKLIQMVPEEAHACCSAKTALLAGQPHEELTKYALVQDVDLIVLGVRGRSLVENPFVGSTTARAVREAPCPVLSVRPTTEEG